MYVNDILKTINRINNGTIVNEKKYFKKPDNFIFRKVIHVGGK